MEVSLDEQGVVAREFLDGLIECMNLEAEVVIDTPEEETIELNLLGQDLGLLIGPKGATLLAIQDLTRTVVQRKTSAANGRILVDVAGYRRKRKDALARFTRQVADEVLARISRRVTSRICKIGKNVAWMDLPKPSIRPAPGRSRPADRSTGCPRWARRARSSCLCSDAADR